jgi:stage II sporulation protein D
MKDYYNIKSTVSISKENLSQAKSENDTNLQFNDIIFKILLTKSKNELLIKSNENINVKNLTNVKSTKEIYILLKDNNININGASISEKEIELTSDGIFELNNRKYRGNMYILLKDNEILVINKVKLDYYLYGVLPSEVISTWDEECLKAQAVAARTFAIFNKMNSKSSYYDLDSNNLFQVYKGFNVETKKTNEAIDQTKDEIMSYNGDVIQSFFHANSGGKTASSEEVWGGKIDYLKSKDDEFCKNGKNYKWEISITSEKISEKLQKNNILIGEIYDIKIMERSESGRIKTLKIYGSSGSITIKGKDFRNYLGDNYIKSTNFSITRQDVNFIFKGFGWGHGVGLSQEGAKGMAENGWDYKKILKYFYSGIDIVKARIK